MATFLGFLATETFKEICPAGHGYTYANSDIRMSLRKAEVDELPSLSSEEQRGHGDQMSNWTIRQKEVQEVLKGGAIDIFPPTDIPARKGKRHTSCFGNSEDFTQFSLNFSEMIVFQALISMNNLF